MIAGIALHPRAHRRADEAPSPPSARGPVVPITWAETRRRLRDDRSRLQALGRRHLVFDPAYLCAWLYRLSRYCHGRGWPGLSRLAWQANVMATGANVSPTSEIGGGLLVPHPAGVVIDAEAGRDLTVMAYNIILGTTLDARRPRLGDAVTLSHHCAVLGTVEVGDGVHLEPGCFVNQDVAAGVRLAAPRQRSRRPAPSSAEAAS